MKAKVAYKMKADLDLITSKTCAMKIRRIMICRVIVLLNSWFVESPFLLNSLLTDSPFVESKSGIL